MLLAMTPGSLLEAARRAFTAMGVLNRGLPFTVNWASSPVLRQTARKILAGNGMLVRAEADFARRSLEHRQISLHGKLELVKGQFISLLGPPLSFFSL